MNCKKIALINGSLCGGGAERFTANFANAIEKDSIYNLFLITAEKKEDEYELVYFVFFQKVLLKIYIQ